MFETLSKSEGGIIKKDETRIAQTAQISPSLKKFVCFQEPEYT